MSRSSHAESEQRVLVFAPIGRDADLTRDLLERAGIPCNVCHSVHTLSDLLTGDGAGALLLTEESLDDPALSVLVTALEQQPPWSDVPILLFAGGRASEMTIGAIRSIETLRNVTLLERPIRIAAVLSTIRSALRGRARQYEVRDLLVALHRARSEAERANRLKDEFLATLSHELRTPLNAILGWTSMLVRGQVDPSRFPRVFEGLDRNAQSQAQLIADVLDVSRIITGKLTLQPTTIDVCDIVARAVDTIRPAAEAKNIAIDTRESVDCFVFGDPDRLQQIFWNLLSNAVKFTPAAGVIDVNIRRDANSVLVTVRDNGIGIPTEFVPFVFDRFRQADQTTTRTHGGLGLGLSIVRHLSELHGGSVAAASDGVGRGAQFEVRLPAVDDASRSATPHSARREGEVRLAGYSILIVDDDHSTREVVTAVLEGADARVQVATSAEEARRRLAEHVPSMIIADLGMPVEDGFSFMRSVRRSSARGVPAIALSAYADQGSRDEALAAGFTAFLAKPARPDTLLDLVASLLNSSSRSPR
jgi:signal transduction histidine kinase/ActR/RegA family two-component response regulator